MRGVTLSIFRAAGCDWSLRLGSRLHIAMHRSMLQRTQRVGAAVVGTLKARSGPTISRSSGEEIGSIRESMANPCKHHLRLLSCIRHYDPMALES
jgi:hypothetical protein